MKTSNAASRSNLLCTLKLWRSIGFMRILCIENDRSVREARSAILESADYQTISASMKFAEILLAYQKYDLVVLSGISDPEVNRIMAASSGAIVLALRNIIKPKDLLHLVAEKLRVARRAPGQAEILDHRLSISRRSET